MLNKSQGVKNLFEVYSTFNSVGTVSLGVARLNAWSNVTNKIRVRTTA